MTVQDILKTLAETDDKLSAAGIDDDSKLELEILVLQLRRQLIVGGFDPLKEIDSVTIVDVSKLPALMQAVDKEIQNEKNRTQLVKKITFIAKSALKAAGLPIPS